MSTPAELLQQKFKQLRAFYFVYLLFALVAMGLFFVSKPAMFAVLGLSLVYHLVFVRPKSKAYEKDFIHTCAQYVLEKHLQNAQHTATPVLEAQAIRNAKLIPENGNDNSIYCVEGGTGTLKEMPVHLGDVVMNNTFLKDGSTHHDFVSGCWVQVALPKDSGLDWRILNKHTCMPQSLAEMRAKYSSLEMPNSDTRVPDFLKESYSILAQSGTPILPSEAILKQLQKLCRNAKTPIGVCIQGNLLHVFLANRLIGQKVNIREAIPVERLQLDFLPELEDISHLAQALCNE